MIKKLSVLLCLISILLLSGCGSNVSQNDYDELVAENKKLKEQLNMTTDDSNELQEITIGENVNVNTQYGEFAIQVDNVRYMEDDDEEDDAIPVVLECIVNNISFSMEDSYAPKSISGYLLSEESNILQLTDKNGVAFSYYDIAMTDGAYAFSHDLKIGSKGREAYPFLVTESQKNVTIIINDQYILNTSLKQKHEKKEYYPDTTIPTFTSVTSIEPKYGPMPLDYEEKLMFAKYFCKKEAVELYESYINSLLGDGWTEYEKENESKIILTKNSETVIIEVDSSDGSVTVAYGNPQK